MEAFLTVNNRTARQVLVSKGLRLNLDFEESSMMSRRVYLGSVPSELINLESHYDKTILESKNKTQRIRVQ